MLAVVGALLIVELGARFFVADWEVQRALRFDPSGQPPCFRLEPSTQTYYEGWVRKLPRTDIAINADGLRGPGVDTGRTRGTARVALVGDSYVFGLGVNFGDTLGEHLAASLAASATIDGAVEVLNFGVPGYDFTAMVQRVREDVRRFCPDLVVLVVCADDLDEPRCGRFADHDSPLRHLALGRLWLASRRQGRPPGKARMSGARVGHLLRTVRTAIGDQAGLAVVTICSLGGTPEEQDFSARVAAAGGTVIRAEPAFTELSFALGTTAIRYDGHLNGAGNRAFAEHLGPRTSPLLARHRGVGATCPAP